MVYFDYLCIRLFIYWGSTCHSMHTEVRRQLVGVSSHLPPCWPWGLNSGCWTLLWQAPVPMTPSRRPLSQLLRGGWAFEFRSSCLHSEHLTHRAVALAPLLQECSLLSQSFVWPEFCKQIDNITQSLPRYACMHTSEILQGLFQTTKGKQIWR